MTQAILCNVLNISYLESMFAGLIFYLASIQARLKR